MPQNITYAQPYSIDHTFTPLWVISVHMYITTNCILYLYAYKIIMTNENFFSCRPTNKCPFIESVAGLSIRDSVIMNDFLWDSGGMRNSIPLAQYYNKCFRVTMFLFIKKKLLKKSFKWKKETSKNLFPIQGYAYHDNIF